MSTAVSVHKNVDTIRRGYQAFNAADLKTLSELFDEHVSWHAPGRSFLAGDYKGREAVFAFFRRLGQETGGTFKAELKHALADDEGRVVGIHHTTAQRGNKHLSAESCLVFEFKNGKVLSGTEFPYDLHAWETFWS